VNGRSRLSAVGSRLVGVIASALVLAATVHAQPSAGGREPRAGRRLPVAARALARGVVLSESDISMVPHAEVPNGNVPNGETPNAGWVTRRAIAAGEVLRAPAVAPPTVVEAGRPVDLVWRDGTLELRLRGVAANSAPLGGRVAVRVDRRRYEGIAAGPAVVRLP
jgi:flagellar basal body P-ring formation protein FlgA